MVRAIRRASREVYGVPWVRPYRRALRLRREHGFRLEESLATGLLDPARTGLGGAVSQRELVGLQRRLAPPGLEPVSEDKVVFAAVAETAGLPVPRTLAVLVAGRPGWSASRGRAIPTGGWAAAIDDLPDQVVLKPAAGYHGHGVLVLTREGGAWRDPEGATCTSTQIAERLEDDRRFDTWIAQERLVTHPDLARLGAPGALHTVRAITLVGDDGTPEVLWTTVRLSVSGGIDNFRGGTTGNLSGEVDPASGTVTAMFGPRSDGLGLLPAEHDPVSGMPLPGLRLPVWDETIALAHRAATALLPLRTLGLDLALTPGGPRLVEINMWWDPIPHVDMRAGLGRLRRAAGDRSAAPAAAPAG
jgi:hypothetical protein